ncbi:MULTISPECIES: DUF4349 domain-containing protein [unclassified Streptomyces]|jgi:hypothetical protein|uniref:DUF4349 domain-containing protein n=1 Tax=unclassified Streptomyces TaxID=2593676 RepID=UPI0007467B3E|nr:MULTISPECIES: DUF4349 domain-containing protein [unclassified Streptomyces]KUL75398.1 hypothetical protein ADL34_15560 [Streptomyces sp. NRRL WC-3605]KUL75584.1 hypothetical protein ADL33_15240 [Streptomyces sp. NRRL WC-3604]
MRARRSARSVQALAGLLLAGALALTGCSGAGDSGASSDSAAGGEAARSDAKGVAPGGAADSGSGGASRRQPSTAPKAAATHIIRTASLTVRVKDVPEALDEARTTVENAGGFVGDETTRRDGDGRERTRVVLRVPVEKYAEVLEDLEGTGKLVERSAKAQDVTDQVVDVESRITSQRASVARIRELMDRATRLSDVVTLEGELSSRQADLEALLAQQASLKDRTSLATITLSLSETPVKKAAPEDDDPGFLDALAGGWDAFVTMLRWLAVVFGAVLPFLAVAALLVLLWVRVLRPRRPARSAAPDPLGTVGPLPAARPAPDATRAGGEQGGERP